MKLVYVFLIAIFALLMVSVRADGNCPTVCGFSYSPVCAADADGKNREFPNECSMKMEKCTNSPGLKIVKTGNC